MFTNLEIVHPFEKKEKSACRDFVALYPRRTTRFGRPPYSWVAWIWRRSIILAARSAPPRCDRTAESETLPTAGSERGWTVRSGALLWRRRDIRGDFNILICGDPAEANTMMTWTARVRQQIHQQLDAVVR